MRLFPLLICLCCPFVALAQEQDAVYFVNMQKVVDESIIGKAAKSDVEGEARKRQLTIESKKSEIAKLRAELDKQKSLLSAAALTERQQIIERKERELVRNFDDQREEIAKLNSVEMKKVVGEIDAVIKEISTQNNYKMVIERDNRLVLYVNSSWDLTDNVIKKLNEKKLGN